MKALTPDETMLGLLAVQARHGYELIDCFRSSHQLGRVWNLSTSQIYAVLKRLEQLGWIAGCEVTSGSAPTRTEYSLSPSGAARLYEWLNEPMPSPSIRRIRVEFLSRLFIAQQLGLPTAPIIERQRKMCVQQYAALLAERDHTTDDIDLLALDLHIAQVEVVIQWLDQCDFAYAAGRRS